MFNSSKSTIWFDVSTLLSWGGHLTGIPRTTASILWEWLIKPPFELKFCAFVDSEEKFRSVTIEDILRWYHHAGWDKSLAKIDVSFSDFKKDDEGTKDIFSHGDILLSFGASWADTHYCSSLFKLKKEISIKIAFLVYDIIPCLYPHTFGPGFGAGFLKWTVDALWCADLVLAISKNTAEDISTFAKDYDLPMPQIEVLRLGENISTKNIQIPNHPAFHFESPFVLNVGTIEVRKNHLLLYYCWQELVRTMADAAPYLVIVGRPGWLTSDAIYQFKNNPLTSKKIVILENINDSELNWLYENSLFTMYPSLYEGWGLPVAESLARGKYCITSHVSSIPEIGGDLLGYHDPLEWQSCLKLVKKALNEPAFLKERESNIKINFKKTTWSETAFSAQKLIENNLIDSMPAGARS